MTLSWLGKQLPFFCCPIYKALCKCLYSFVSSTRCYIAISVWQLQLSQTSELSRSHVIYMKWVDWALPVLILSMVWDCNSQYHHSRWMSNNMAQKLLSTSAFFYIVYIKAKNNNTMYLLIAMHNKCLQMGIKTVWCVLAEWNWTYRTLSFLYQATLCNDLITLYHV